MATTPVLYLSHGAPPLADDPTWPGELARWTAGIERPAGILIVSAHWESAPVALSSTTGAPLLHDFWGFPQKYYQVVYPAPPAPALAEATARLLAAAGHTVARDESRGLDHGAYVPLVQMYRDADVPVVQLSMPTLAPQALFGIGERLAPLREEGVLIVGSGFTTHNLAWFDPGAPAEAAPPAASREFDQWAAEALAAHDVDRLLTMTTVAPAARQAHPRTEHWAPMYVALGAAAAGGSLGNRSVIDGFWYGLSKRSWQFG